MGSRSVVDVVILGANALGLAQAYVAQARGLSVAVISEEPPAAEWTAYTHTGLVSATTLSGSANGFVARSAQTWALLARRLGFWVSQTGSVVIARTDAECGVIDEFSRCYPATVTRELAAVDVIDMVGSIVPDLRRAVHLPEDLVVDLPDALPALAAHLDDEGVDFAWATPVTGIDDIPGSSAPVRVVSSAGHVDAQAVIVCTTTSPVGPARRYGMTLATPGDAAGRGTGFPAVLGGASMLSHAAMADTRAADAVFEEHAHLRPDMLGARVDLEVLPTPAGGIQVGSVQQPGHTDSVDVVALELMRAEAEQLVGASLTATQIWSAAGLWSSGVSVSTPTPRVRTVTAPAHLHAALSFGLADDLISDVASVRRGMAARSARSDTLHG